ncbi:hypothetical protein jhhlp_007628 [Lomentospora prolificans]|uniref:ORP1 like protein n=1 Tax=Lomentospora prolificans TaxID=41688 RepID=A0A2N3N049_9PEZI|nr:hypothetical protein jhhlp_007628 [Lomentospora prolificans]
MDRAAYMSWAGLPTPSPEKSPPRSTNDYRLGLKSRTPWDAGGYSLPLSLDTKFFPSAQKPAIYSDSLDSTSLSALSAVTPSSGHSRTTSLESSPADMISSALVSPMTSAQPFKPGFLGEINPQLEISTGRRLSTASEMDAQLTARKPSFPSHHGAPASPMGSPKSPKHKFSDSHSSLSSYSPSTQSGGHSRISSFSTVSMAPTVSTLLNEIPSIEEKSERSEQERWNTNALVLSEDRPASGGLPQLNNGTPPRLGSLGVEPRRPSSPSDAFLIARGEAHQSPSSNNSQLQPHPENLIEQSNDHQDTLNPLPNSLSRFPQHSSHLKPIHKHKRAISAPSFAAFRPQPSGPAYPARVFPPPPSQQTNKQAPLPQQPHPQTHHGFLAQAPIATLPSLARPPKMASGPMPRQREQNLHIRCERVENCDTGTDRRKLISHVFGRNKLCTRAIPQEVWVHYCRKHYQRERYRKGPEYAKLQADLILVQIDRIQAWSDGNAAANEGPIVKDWALSIRKREQQRRKRNQDDGEEEDEEDEDAIALGTAVPDWLAGQAGAGYTTGQIKEIMAQLRDEVNAGNLLQLPDIEILPNIEGAVAPRRPQKRRSKSSISHRRTQSMGVPIANAIPPIGDHFVFNHRRGSQPAIVVTEEANRVEKRKAEDALDGPFVPPSTRRTALVHRPAFQQIQEERPEHLEPHSLSAPQPRHGRSRSDMSHLLSEPRNPASFKPLPSISTSIARIENEPAPGAYFNTDPFRTGQVPGRQGPSFDDNQVSRLGLAQRRRVSTPNASYMAHGPNSNPAFDPLQRLPNPFSMISNGPGQPFGHGQGAESHATTLPSISQMTGEDFHAQH